MCITIFFLPPPLPLLSLCLPVSVSLSLPPSLFPRKTPSFLQCTAFGECPTKVLTEAEYSYGLLTFYLEASHIEHLGATLPIRTAPPPAPCRQPPFIPRAGGRPKKRRTWPNCRHTKRVHIGHSQAIFSNPTPTSSDCILHSFSKTRCNKHQTFGSTQGALSLRETLTLSYSTPRCNKTAVVIVRYT